MALPSSGSMSMGANLNLELGIATTTQISLGQATVRTVYGVASGAIRLAADGYGKAREFVFNQIISSDTTDYNLRNSAIAAGWDQSQPLNATVTINSGVYVYASSTGIAAFSTGSSFPSGSSLNLINNGYIYGRGGNGGSAAANNGQWGSSGGGGQTFGSAGVSGTAFGNSGTSGGLTSAGSGGAQLIRLVAPDTYPFGTPGSGTNGGPAMRLDAPLRITNNSVIGGGGGGGGAGAVLAPLVQVGGTFQNPQYAMRLTTNASGNGGTLGSSGSAGVGTIVGAGGAAGSATIGNSNITWVALGTIYGALN